MRGVRAREWAALALPGTSAVLMLAAIEAALVLAPTERVMGPLQRIFYFHLSDAIAAFAAFVVAFGASVAYLARGERRWDALAVSAVEVGELFSTLVLLTGMLWARMAWNTWWTWDPRLTTMLVLWLLYAGYLMLRASLEDEARRARYAAVLAVLGFLDVPIVFMAIRWWRTIHPVLFDASGAHMEPAMLAAVVVSLLAFIGLLATLLVARVRLELLSGDVDELHRRLL